MERKVQTHFQHFTLEHITFTQSQADLMLVNNVRKENIEQSMWIKFWIVYVYCFGYKFQLTCRFDERGKKKKPNDFHSGFGFFLRWILKQSRAHVIYYVSHIRSVAIKTFDVSENGIQIQQFFFSGGLFSSQPNLIWNQNNLRTKN